MPPVADNSGHSVELIDGEPTPIGMVRKLIFAAFILAYGAWLLTYPARTAGLHGWRDCMTVKGMICIPERPTSAP
jgi:hypothetical protein